MPTDAPDPAEPGAAAGPVAGADAGTEAEVPMHRGAIRRHLDELNTLFVILLLIVLVACLAIGWRLHPQSTGYATVPEHITGSVVFTAGAHPTFDPYTSGSSDGLVESLTRADGNGAVLEIQVPTSGGTYPDGNSTFQLRWTLTVARPSGATVCTPRVTSPKGRLVPDPYGNYYAGFQGTSTGNGTNPAAGGFDTNTLPIDDPSPNFLPWSSRATTVPDPNAVSAPGPGRPAPPRVPALVISGTGYVYVKLCWAAPAPVTLNGAYLNAYFPPIAGAGFHKAVHRLVPTDGDTLNYTVTSKPDPAFTSSSQWFWSDVQAQSDPFSGQSASTLTRVTAINSTALQQDSFHGFLSGIMLGIAGGVLISVITEVAKPLTRKGGD